MMRIWWEIWWYDNDNDDDDSDFDDDGCGGGYDGDMMIMRI